MKLSLAAAFAIVASQSAPAMGTCTIRILGETSIRDFAARPILAVMHKHEKSSELPAWQDCYRESIAQATALGPTKHVKLEDNGKKYERIEAHMYTGWSFDSGGKTTEGSVNLHSDLDDPKTGDRRSDPYGDFLNAKTGNCSNELVLVSIDGGVEYPGIERSREVGDQEQCRRSSVNWANKNLKIGRDSRVRWAFISKTAPKARGELTTESSLENPEMGSCRTRFFGEIPTGEENYFEGTASVTVEGPRAAEIIQAAAWQDCYREAVERAKEVGWKETKEVSFRFNHHRGLTTHWYVDWEFHRGDQKMTAGKITRFNPFDRPLRGDRRMTLEGDYRNPQTEIVHFELTGYPTARTTYGRPSLAGMWTPGKIATAVPSGGFISFPPGPLP